MLIYRENIKLNYLILNLSIPIFNNVTMIIKFKKKYVVKEMIEIHTLLDYVENHK